MRRAERTHSSDGANAWVRFWFAPGSARRLGLCRCAYVAALLYAIPLQDVGSWADVPATLWAPVALFRVLGWSPASAGTLDAMGRVLHVSLVTGALGVLTRPSLAVAALLMAYLVGLQQSFGIAYHSTATAPLVLLTLAVARSGDAWSLDRIFRRVRAPLPTAEASAAGEYTWPIRLVQVLSTLVFFAAGVAKLRHSGLAWVVSDNLRDVLLGQHYDLAAPTRPWGLDLAEHRGLCTLGALSIVLVEALAPLALVSTTAASVLIPALFAFVVGLPALLGIRFDGLLPIFVFWIGSPGGRGEVQKADRGVPR